MKPYIFLLPLLFLSGCQLPYTGHSDSKNYTSTEYGIYDNRYAGNYPIEISPVPNAHVGLLRTTPGKLGWIPVSNTNSDVGTLIGRSTHTDVLHGLMVWSDGGIGEAAQRAGINHISTVDHSDFKLLWGLYEVRTAVITGDPANSSDRR